MSFENECNFHENEPVNGTNFHIKGFARTDENCFDTETLTQNWPICS